MRHSAGDRCDLGDMIEVVRLRGILVAVDLRLRLPAVLNRRWLSPAVQAMGNTPGAHTARKLERLSRLTRIAASRRFGEEMTCLRRSLALRYRLGRMGVRARLVYGMGKSEGRTRAHAWLEIGNATIDTYGTHGRYGVFHRPRD